MNSIIRPTLLTVLCILTFIGSGYNIFNGFTSYTTADTVVGMTKDVLEETKDKMEAQSKDDKGTAFANKLMDVVFDKLSTENVKRSAIATIVASIFTLLGAILMWGLDKRGFWSYLVGTAVIILAPVFIFGGWIGLAAAGFQAILGVLFAILYGVNLKFMH